MAKKPTQTEADLLTRIDSIRGDIESIRNDLEDLAAASLTAAEAKQHATAAVSHMAQSFNLPSLARTFAHQNRATHGTDTVFRHIGWLDIADSRAVLALLAVTLPDALEKALHTEIDRQVGDAGISAAERARRVEAAEQRLFELGCEEERLIVEAESAGQVIYRRPDCDPACVLGFFASVEAA